MLVLWKIWSGMIENIACRSYLKILDVALSVSLCQFDKKGPILKLTCIYTLRELVAGCDILLMASLADPNWD